MRLAFCLERTNHINKPLVDVKIVRENKTELKLKEGNCHDIRHVRKHVRVAFCHLIIFINYENYINIFSKDNHNYNKLHQLEEKHPKSANAAEEELS